MGLYTNLIQTKIFSSYAGQCVGEDDLGNKYYQEKMLFGRPQRILRRWVIYKSGQVDGSNVPAKWFSWLHYTSERPLAGTPHKWEKTHLHNKTGSHKAHHNPATLSNEQKKPKTAHQTWSPKKNPKTTP